MKTVSPSLALAFALSVVLTGCATPNTSGRTYSSSNALSQQTAELARVVLVRDVLIRPAGDRSAGYVGTVIGAAVGYTATRHASGAFRGLGTIVGGAAGAAAGSAVANRHGLHAGVQIFVQRLNHEGRPFGQLIAVVQDADQRMVPGQIVLLVTSRDGLSVAPASGTASTPRSTNFVP